MSKLKCSFLPLLWCPPFHHSLDKLERSLRAFIFRGLAHHPPSRYLLMSEWLAQHNSQHCALASVINHTTTQTGIFAASRISPSSSMADFQLQADQCVNCDEPRQIACTSNPRQLRSQWSSIFLSFLYTQPNREEVEIDKKWRSRDVGKLFYYFIAWLLLVYRLLRPTFLLDYPILFNYLITYFLLFLLSSSSAVRHIRY